MAGLCEGGNEPPGSLKASKYSKPLKHIFHEESSDTSSSSQKSDPELRPGVGSIPTWTDYLVGFIPRFSPTVMRMSVLKAAERNPMGTYSNGGNERGRVAGEQYYRSEVSGQVNEAARQIL
ncbi:hypothetical protein ANN_00840 [Periplaneta americana]|uniref:Uncharacterized protein n=1 Tax=Periplaneta americana TaxID=6978 RepID=A0ABQ8TRW8_PERAM|nr:hypothetical protein ANN_00840 [Periplaneta americana]